MRRQLWPAVKMVLVMTVLTGLAYPLLVTGISQSTFPEQASGSLIEFDGQVVGSRLLGQAFSGNEYFHPRPSEVSYDPTSSSASNLGPTNPELLGTVATRIDRYRSVNRLDRGAFVPIDAVTTSASGLDPHISMANALLQAPRVAQVRGMDLDAVLQLVEDATIQGGSGVLGSLSVNVLVLNISLEEASP
jgi:K+-transporting ATPase ATPase C chain